MTYLRVLNASKQSVLGTRIGVADTRWLRLRGYLFRPEPAPGEGLMIVPCRGVHMYGMRYALDVVLLDRTGHVLAMYPELQPRTRSGVHREAKYAVELPVGTIAATGTSEGDNVIWLPSNAAANESSSAQQRNEIRRRAAASSRPILGGHAAAQFAEDREQA